MRFPSSAFSISVSATLLPAFLAPVQSAEACEARAAADKPPAVVELYTSEGCSSCPPADRWLSRIEPATGVVALAFHVDYWNHLGWQDRYASPALTQRQYAIRAALHLPYVYTPQVVLNGADLRGWRALDPGRLPRLPAGEAPGLRLHRDGDRVVAEVDGSSVARRNAGYWAVLADRRVSRVAAGENAGATLTHDHVVVDYRPVEAWGARDGNRVAIDAPASDPPHRIAFVITDSNRVRPVQAVVLSCAGS
jgi:hypothetical protein